MLEFALAFVPIVALAAVVIVPTFTWLRLQQLGTDGALRQLVAATQVLGGTVLLLDSAPVLLALFLAATTVACTGIARQLQG